LLERNDGARGDCHGFFWDLVVGGVWRLRCILGLPGTVNDREVSVRVAIWKSENNQADAETEDVDIAEDEDRKETKTDELNSLR
jgi:hypothetical protein